ncbi:Chromatin accessibility complex protein 1 [Armadillidium nasatum]|uniref:Chromatin accessibility complex protein 1 n=1 Tax=Armadillidium nasatum TaxID=96803 RepID=A0A5N5T1B8_9CRUS|nr:Chromatin accessibility complex protein 1 [Armadillidium nasatum]
MSLMNYGFTKSKLDEKFDEKRPEGKSKEKSPSKSSKSSPKSAKEGSSSSKESKDKKDKISGSKSTSKKESHKSDTKSPVKKSTSKKPSSNVKQKPHNISPNTNSSSKMNGVHKLHSKSDGSSISNNGSSSSSSSNNSPKKSPHDVSLPYVRIKMIMKSCPDVEIVPHESLHVITKATELFIQHLATESLKSSDCKMLDYEALSNRVHKEDNLEFLKETIPKKITWEECQKIIASKKANSSSEMI